MDTKVDEPKPQKVEDKKPKSGKCPTCGRDTVNS